MSNDVSFSITKGKYIISKDSAYLALTLEQIKQVGEIAKDIDKLCDPTESEYYKKDARNH